MNLLRKLQHMLDIHRLERRYTRRAHRSTKWTDAAIYVDGEYVYPSSSSSPMQSSSTQSSSTVSPSWTSTLAALAGYSFDLVATGANINGRGEWKRVGEGESEGVEMRTWRGKGQKGKGKGASVGEREGEGGRKRMSRTRREGAKGKPSSATASPTYTSTLASLAGYCYDPVAAGAYMNDKGERKGAAHAEDEGEVERRRTWRGRGERGTGKGREKGKRARIRIWVRQVVGR